MGGRRGHKRKHPGADTSEEMSATTTLNVIQEGNASNTSHTNGDQTIEPHPTAPSQSTHTDSIEPTGSLTESIHSTPKPSTLEPPVTAQMPESSDTIPQKPARAVRSAAEKTAYKRQRREEYRANMQSSEGQGLAELPKKRFYRQRAHANPFSDHALDYPVSPEDMDWSPHYPDYVFKERDEEVVKGTRRPGQLKKNIEVADVGCGFGGLLFALAPKIPDTLILGLEIRVSVTEFVQNKIRAMRHQALQGREGGGGDANSGVREHNASTTQSTVTESPSTPHIPSTTNTLDSTLPHSPDPPSPPTYSNISAHRTNTMKFLPNFLPARSLSSLFLCFPDPHFKARKHKARIVSPALVSEYHYVVRPGGRVYTITDVEDLHGWMCRGFEDGVKWGGWRRVSDDEIGSLGADHTGDNEGIAGGNGSEATASEGEVFKDWKVGVMWSETEEGKKVERNGGKRFVGVWERLETPAWPGQEVG